MFGSLAIDLRGSMIGCNRPLSEELQVKVFWEITERRYYSLNANSRRPFSVVMFVIGEMT